MDTIPSRQSPAVVRQPDMEAKLAVLAEAAKYDVSCVSSGTSGGRENTRIGNAALGGICHSWSEDGRCISLLKVLFSNDCVYDCAYCANRRSNSIRRATFTVGELAALTIGFYRRNCIEGLFLSSAVFSTPDRTMEALVLVAEALRREHGFGGYIHLKAIPGAAPALVERAALVADRLSVNIELPTERSLNCLAPQKKKEAILGPMRQISEGVREWHGERRRHWSAPLFAPAGQSTQLMVGASPEHDLHILRLSAALYKRFGMRRVFYSGYVPVNEDNRLPAAVTPPMLREHRLYQADWLLRFYGFGVEELLDDGRPDLEEAFDPKTSWALRHPEWFPLEVNSAAYEQILRIPGLGVRSARKIIAARRFGKLCHADLKRLGVVMKRAEHFVLCDGRYFQEEGWDPVRARAALAVPAKRGSFPANTPQQLDFFNEPAFSGTANRG